MSVIRNPRFLESVVSWVVGTIDPFVSRFETAIENAEAALADAARRLRGKRKRLLAKQFTKLERIKSVLGEFYFAVLAWANELGLRERIDRRRRGGGRRLSFVH